MKHHVNHRSNRINSLGRPISFKKPTAQHRWRLSVFYLILTTLILLLAQPGMVAAVMAINTGSYVGDGNNPHSITVGFDPDVVIIKGDLNKRAQITTVRMQPDSTKEFIGFKAPTSGLIKSLDSNGFTVGSSQEVNT
jgi:hypothetical protein